MMMRLALLCALVIAEAQFAGAQVRITGGFTGGISLSSIGGPDAPSDAKLFVGHIHGAFLELSFAGFPVIFRPEILASYGGYQIDDRFVSPLPEGPIVPRPFRVSYSQRSWFIQLPVLAQVSLPSLGDVQPLVFAGPSISFCAGSRLSGILRPIQEPGESIPSAFITDENSWDLNSPLCGTMMGVRFVVLVGIKFSLEARYYLGLSSMFKDFAESVPTATGEIGPGNYSGGRRNVSIHDQALSVSLGIGL